MNFYFVNLCIVILETRSLNLHDGTVTILVNRRVMVWGSFGFININTVLQNMCSLTSLVVVIHVVS